MITITARCLTCGRSWTPRKADGPDRDYCRARAWANAHGRANPRHIIEAKSNEVVNTPTGSRIRMLNMEITRR